MANAKPQAVLRWAVPAIVLAGALAWGGWLLWNSRPETAPQPEGGVNKIVPGVVGGRIDETLLRTIAWADVTPTVEAIGANKTLRTEVAAIAANTSHNPALFLRGLLLLAGGEAAPALAAFDRIPVEEIPADLLYAPYRLHQELRPSQPNPFRLPVQKALAEDRLSPLTRARVLLHEGRRQEALTAYLNTDPAAWTEVDLRGLRGLRMHAGLARDTAVMLQAALKGGRLPDTLRTQVVAIITAPRDDAALEDLKAQFLGEINRNPDLRRAALTGAVQQLAARQQFVSRNYRELLDQHGARSPGDLPDETVLMLVLSAARLGDESAFAHWAQELKRRFPTPEIERWLNQLRNPSPSSAP